MTRITVACLDMAGTTVRDDGTVIAAFQAAIASHNLPVAAYNEAMKYVRATMGQSKIEVFRHILGDEDDARRANAAFEKHYAAAVSEGEIAPMPGATEVFQACRSAGLPPRWPARSSTWNPSSARSRASRSSATRPVPGSSPGERPSSPASR